MHAKMDDTGQKSVGGTMGTIITFKRPDGKDASGYLANAARGDAPGVVVIQEWWGLQDQIKGICERFARAGFDALAPDLYKGKVVPYHDTDAAGKEMNSLDFMDATTQSVRGAVQYLARNGAKVGLTGFCMGGAVTIIGAAKIPELTAGVVFYGIPPEQAAKAADVKIPLQAHFASKDDWCRRPANRSSSTATRPITALPTSSAWPCMTARPPSSPGAAPPPSSTSTSGR